MFGYLKWGRLVEAQGRTLKSQGDEIERLRNALWLISAQGDEALIAAGVSDPLWAKRVAVAALNTERTFHA